MDLYGRTAHAVELDIPQAPNRSHLQKDWKKDKAMSFDLSY